MCTRKNKSEHRCTKGQVGDEGLLESSPNLPKPAPIGRSQTGREVVEPDNNLVGPGIRVVESTTESFAAHPKFAAAPLVWSIPSQLLQEPRPKLAMIQPNLVEPYPNVLQPSPIRSRTEFARVWPDLVNFGRPTCASCSDSAPRQFVRAMLEQS